jgi:hypothetical protein
VIGIDLKEGVITVEPLLEELELKAWLPGRVEKVTDKGCVIANSGAVISGIWGHGGETSGQLTMDDGGPGDMVIQKTTNRRDLEKFRDQKINGLVTGSLNLIDFDELAPKFIIVLTEGFGDEPMPATFFEALRGHIGQIMAVDAVTQLRAGVKRPRVILPEMTH